MESLNDSEVSGQGNISDGEESDTEQTSDTLGSANMRHLPKNGETVLSDGDLTDDEQGSSSEHSLKCTSNALVQKQKNTLPLGRSRGSKSDEPERVLISEELEDSDGELTDDESDSKDDDDDDIDSDYSGGEYSETGNVSDNESSDKNTRWAASMAQILQTSKPQRKKNAILSVAKSDFLAAIERKVDEEFEKEGAGFEVLGEDDSVKQDLKERKLKRKLELLKEGLQKETTSKRKKRYIWEKECRAKPNILQKDVEKNLAKIATKGVVQLFNAIRQHQKEVKAEFQNVGLSVLKRDKVLEHLNKDSFIGLLNVHDKKEAVQKTKKTAPILKDDDEDEPNWKALQDNYMMGASLKNWDKDSDEENSE